MNFFESIEFAQAVALLTAGLLFGVPLGWKLHRWHSRREHRRAMRRKAHMLSPKWGGFERHNQPWETITCDRRTPEHPSVLYQACNPPRDRGQ